MSADPRLANPPGVKRPDRGALNRFAAISGSLTGSRHLWMGANTMAPGQRSGEHHRGEADSGSYIVSGHPRFVFLAAEHEVHVDAGPGDFVYVPAWVPHREEKPSAEEEAVVILARSTPEEIVINLPDLWSLHGIAGHEGGTVRP